MIPDVISGAVHVVVAVPCVHILEAAPNPALDHPVLSLDERQCGLDIVERPRRASLLVLAIWTTSGDTAVRLLPKLR